MRIAVVDPSRTVLKAVSQLLESDGHVISVFVDGHDALDFIKTNSDVNALITSAELDTCSMRRPPRMEFWRNAGSAAYDPYSRCGRNVASAGRNHNATSIANWIST